MEKNAVDLPECGVFHFCFSLRTMYALVKIGGIVKWIPHGLEGRGAVVEKKGEIVIIRLDKKREGRDGGQHGCYKRAKRLFRVEQ